MGLFKKKNKDLLSTFDGRCVKYVTRKVKKEDGTYEYVISGKSGRIAVIEDNIRIICGENDVFNCEIKNCRYFLLLNGDGVTVEGNNTVTGEFDSFTAYYTYYRK